MARKKKNELIELLMLLPWWLTLAIGLFGAGYLRWLLPSTEFNMVELSAIAQHGPSFSLIWLLICCSAAILSLVNRAEGKILYRSVKNGKSINSVSWNEFEQLIAEYYRKQGFKAKNNFYFGADGGKDVIARKDGKRILIQCKHWKTRKVGVSVVREMFGIMVAENFDEAHIVASGSFTKEAKVFAKGKPIKLVDKEALSTIPKLKPTAKKHERIEPKIEIASNTDSAELCPKCGSELIKRVARKGAHAGTEFLGCTAFPKCRYIKS